MSRHHCRQIFFHRGPKRFKFNFPQSIFIMGNLGQLQMRIFFRIPVPGKMFARRQSCNMTVLVGGLQSADGRPAVGRHLPRMISVRPRADDGIVGIYVHIQYGRQIHVYPQSPQQPGAGPPHALYPCWSTCGTLGHGGGERNAAFIFRNSIYRSSFLIHRQQQRNVRCNPAL